MGFAIAVVALLAAAIVWLMTMESRMLYYPVRPLEATPQRMGWAFEEVELTASDGVMLHAWWIPAAADTSFVPLAVLFLHGNAGNISHRLEKLEILRGVGLGALIVDYRGYGRSQGRPSEAGLYRDARAAYDHLVHERGIDSSAIILYGESLGSAAAVDLAGQVPVAGVVLESAFTSAVDVGQAMFPLLPVRWVMRDRFEVERKIARVGAPILVLHSRDDEYFPMRHAERLVAAAGRAQLFELAGGHNDAFLVSREAYRRALVDFLARVRSL
jgi:hypothetical protein